MRLITDMVAYTVDADPEVEPDQRLLLSPPGGRRDAGAGDRVRDGERDRRARRGARARRRARGRDAPRGRPHLVLPERGHPLRRGDLQDARDGRALGRDHARALRRRRPSAAPLPLRRAGEQPRPHRGAAREQRDPDRARGARRHALARSARCRALQLPGLERGARPAAAVGPAVVAAHPADPRLRDRPARVRRPVRRLARDRGADARARRERARRARARARDGRRGRRGRERLHEAALVESQHAAAARDRERRAHRGRRERLHRDASRRRSRPAGAVDPGGGRVRRARADRARCARSARKRNAARGGGALRELDDALRTGRERDAASRSAPRTRASRRASGPTRCAALRRVPRADRRRRAAESAAASDATAAVRERVHALGQRLGRPLKILVGKPGLDGHSNGAEQIAVRARDVGMEVVYEGIRLTPEEIVELGARRGRARDRALDPLRLARRARGRTCSSGLRDGGLRRAAGRRRRHHPRGGRARRCASAGVRASTRRRTSTSRASWTRSSTSSPRRALPR